MQFSHHHFRTLCILYICMLATSLFHCYHQIINTGIDPQSYHCYHHYKIHLFTRIRCHTSKYQVFLLLFFVCLSFCTKEVNGEQPSDTPPGEPCCCSCYAHLGWCLEKQATTCSRAHMTVGSPNECGRGYWQCYSELGKCSC